MGGEEKCEKSCISLSDGQGQYFSAADWLDFWWSTGGYDYVYFRCSQSDMAEDDIGENYCNEAKRAESYSECRNRILHRGENCCYGEAKIKGEIVNEIFCASAMDKDERAYKAKELYDLYQSNAKKEKITYEKLYFKCGDKDSYGDKVSSSFGLKFSLTLLSIVAVFLF